MTLRINEVQRVLKPTGSFYLHCDPTASHYLKLVLDGIFLPRGGQWQNEIAWCYGSGGATPTRFSRKHDNIFFYTKGSTHTFNVDDVREPYSSPHKSMTPKKVNGKSYTKMNPLGRIPFDWWQIPILTNSDKERLGYPTQKPEALLERIILASSNEGDVVMDAYCGCGTTVAVAQRLNRQWIGLDITYQSIALILRRLEAAFGKDVTDAVILSGVPKDMASAEALALKKDDRTRKEFEKWALLTYSNNRAIINEKKGADGGVDGIAYTQTGGDSNAKVVFQVKSGNVKSGDIDALVGVMSKVSAELSVFITLKEATAPMKGAAASAGTWLHPVMNKRYARVRIVTIKEMLESGARLDLPMSIEVLKKAAAVTKNDQLTLNTSPDAPDDETQDDK